MLKLLAKHSVVAFFIFFGPSEEPEFTLDTIFQPAIIEEAANNQWEWYCDDSRDVADVIKVIYPSGRVTYSDPDICDSDVAKRGR